MTAVNRNLPSPLHFKDFASYFQAVSQAVAPTGKRRMPDSEWATRLGYGSRRTVGMIRDGRRVPSGEFIERLGRYLGQNTTEQKYLSLLAKLAKRITDLEREKIDRELDQLRAKQISRKVLAESEINYIAHWYNLAIKQLVSLPGFTPDPELISRRLRGKVDAKSVQRALDQMVRLGILEKTEGPEGYKVAADRVTTTADIPVAAIRMHHLEQINRAREALTEVSIDKREFYSLTLTMDPARILEAKGVIRKFMDEFDQRFGTSDGKEVYQVCLQCFPHTEEEGKPHGTIH